MSKFKVGDKVVVAIPTDDTPESWFYWNPILLDHQGPRVDNQGSGTGNVSIGQSSRDMLVQARMANSSGGGGESSRGHCR